LLKNYLATNPPHQYQYRVAIQLGTLSINKPDYPAALHWYQQAQAVNNGKLEMDAAVGAAIASANLGHKQAAIDYYRKAIALTDQSADAPSNSGIENYKNSIRALGGTP
jgi:tetratricopeptide (TPR) repeat protein